MKIYFRLNKQLDANYLLQKIQQLINQSNPNEDSIIEISVKSISYDNSTIIPKLEYKGEISENQI